MRLVRVSHSSVLLHRAMPDKGEKPRRRSPRSSAQIDADDQRLAGRCRRRSPRSSPARPFSKWTNPTTSISAGHDRREGPGEDRHHLGVRPPEHAAEGEDEERHEHQQAPRGHLHVPVMLGPGLGGPQPHGALAVGQITPCAPPQTTIRRSARSARPSADDAGPAQLFRRRDVQPAPAVTHRCRSPAREWYHSAQTDSEHHELAEPRRAAPHPPPRSIPARSPPPAATTPSAPPPRSARSR